MSGLIPCRLDLVLIVLQSAEVAYLPFFFFFNDTATTEIYTLSLHDALPISRFTSRCCTASPAAARPRFISGCRPPFAPRAARSEEHTSELQSRPHLVCRLLLEKKKTERRGGARVTRWGRAGRSRP